MRLHGGAPQTQAGKPQFPDANKKQAQGQRKPNGRIAVPLAELTPWKTYRFGGDTEQEEHAKPKEPFLIGCCVRCLKVPRQTPSLR